MPNPLHDVPNQRQVWSWISFDIANQSFTLVINTLLFAIFFGKVVVNNDAIDDRLWALTFGSSMLLTAFLSPILGAAADERSWKKELLIGSGLTCAFLTCCLALVGPGQVGLAMAIYIPANLAFQLGENFLSSFLPTLARTDQLGRVSAFSWALSYCAAFVLLILTAGLMVGLGLQAPPSWRPLFVFAGLWFFTFMIPTMIWLREPDGRTGTGNFVAAALRRLADTIRHTARYRDLVMLLGASLFYGTAMSVVIFFAGKLADQYGFNQVKLIGFVAVITVSGIIGTLLPMLWQDRLGHRRTTLILLTVWLFTSVGFAGYAFAFDANPKGTPSWPLWVIGNLLGFGLGALGSANRAFVGYLAPEGKAGETYGLWGMTMKLSALMTFPFAWVRDSLGTPSALLVLAGFVVAGMVLTFLVDEHRGRAATSL